MSMFPGDMSSRIRAYESGLGPNPFQRMPQVPDVMPMQPRGGIAGLFERLRRPQLPPMGGFGGGRFGPPPFNPMMRGGFLGMGGGFFGGFRPRFRRRPRPQMPDYSSQISGLEAKIAELQEQLAARQAATPTPDPVMDVPEPRVGTLGGTGFGEYPLGTAGPRNIPQIDPVALKELQDRIAGAITPMAPPVSVPNIDLPELGMEGSDVGAMMALPKRGGMLPRGDVGGRKMIKPPSIERIMPPKQKQIKAPIVKRFEAPIENRIVPPSAPPTRQDFMSIERLDEPFIPPRMQEPMPEPMPMPAQMPMPSLPKFPMPQIDPMGRVAAPLTRGPVNAAMNRPMVGMRGPGPRIR
jgi:hypothetical protein